MKKDTKHAIRNAKYEQAVAALKANDHEMARSLLLDVVEADERSEMAWRALYTLFDRNEDKRICLENLITLNPDNQWAKQELLKFLVAKSSISAPQLPLKPAPSSLPPPVQTTQPKPAPAAPQQPERDWLPTVTYRLITAFWLGISFIFLSGGIIASVEWLIAGLRSRTLPDYITISQLIELIGALVFFVIGLLSLTVGLFYRTQIGFYGSLLLGLGLLLVGPSLSLIAVPPQYLTVICTGGMAIIIVLLTLASIAEFNSDTSQL